MTHSTTDVLIVGAGPTGTALAIDLARRGVSVRLVDKATRAFDGSRAKGIQPRTLEVLYDLGALPKILARGGTYPPMGIHVGPVMVPLRMMAKGKLTPEVPFPDTWLIPQSSTVEVLHETLESLGVRTELGTELISLEDVERGVCVRLVADGATEEVAVRYLVGADGASSIVRKRSGITFEGSTDDADRILIVDAGVTGTLSRNHWHIWPGVGGRFVGACPLPLGDLFQWMIRLSPDEDPPVTLDEINDRIQSHTRDEGLRLRDIAWRSVFRPNIRLAEHYRHGRVLLAGDAAHVHTPAGAQGLNTGIGDAYNLGWKLAQVLAGADDALLDTYEAERRPIAADVLGLSTRKYQGIGKLDPRAYRRGADEKQLGLTYRGGPLASPAAERTDTLRVGDRAPDADLISVHGERVRLFDAYRGPHFTVIGYGPSAAEAVSRLDWPTTGASLHRLIVDAGSARGGAESVALIDGSGRFRRSYGLTRETLLLIRPDGYVGHVATRDLLRGTGTVIAALAPVSKGDVPAVGQALMKRSDTA